MKNKFLSAAISFLVMFAIAQKTYGQYGSLKFCPNTPAWNSNKSMMSDKKGMFNEYALGPDGCWWLKSAKHASYAEGYYQFTNSGTKFYFNKKKNYWEDNKRKVCVNPPFGR